VRKQFKLAGALGLLAAGTALAWTARKAASGPSHDGGVAYPPVDTLKQIADDLWIVDGTPINTLGLKLPVRMTIVRLPSGDLLLHSPTRHAPALAKAIERLGPVRHLIAPSTGHWQFLEEWQDAVPAATTWAVPGLRDRWQVRNSAVRIDQDLGIDAPKDWAEQIEQGIIEGVGFSEAWFFHRASRTLLLTDLIDNMEPARLPPVTSIVMKLAGATSGTTPHHVRAALLLKRNQNRDALRNLVSLHPERVVFAHGKWFERDGGRQLSKALNWLTRSG
tara:strand:+ start:4749 stop:5579 length:831 start_codon:yes stop_codon:yes gene_type:complete